jgi:hypothetical protein
MAFETLSLGLTLTIPTNGTTNWGTTLKNTTWTKISSHDHTGSGNGSLIPTAGLNDNAVTSAKLAHNIGFEQATTLTPTGTTQTIDFDNGIIQTVDLGSATGNVTLTLSNPQQGAFYLIYFVQGATARTLVWPGTVKWPQAQAIILSTAEDDVDYVYMYYNGTEYRALMWDQNIS